MSDDAGLGPAELVLAFADTDVAEAYQHRPPYPPEVFGLLAGLIADDPRRVLDIGAGEGALARPLAALADEVDALDISAAMLAAGVRRPGGMAANLRWIQGAAETADLRGPYALVTAGASVHWMAGATTLPRLAGLMTANAVLAIVAHDYHDVPWDAELTEIIVRHSRSPGFDPSFRSVDVLSASGLLLLAGQVSYSAQVRQSVDDYIEQFHSRSALARTWMPPSEAAVFDTAVRRIVEPYALGGMLELAVLAEVYWGRPVAAG
jgi:trans-aconitate methyltransferase